MSLRARFTLSFAVAGTLVAAFVGVLNYLAASEQVVAQANRTLRLVTLAMADEQMRSQHLADPGAQVSTLDRDRLGAVRDEAEQAIVQVVAQDGKVTHLGGPEVVLPVSDSVRALAASGEAGAGEQVTEIVVNGDTYCQRTVALGEGRGALQAAVPIGPTRDVLESMAKEIAGGALAVVLAASVVGWLLARCITRRLVRLARAAEEVSGDRHLAWDVSVEGRDEVGRLAVSFNRMIGRLAASREAQERLVEDAAHELRTPLTSLSTNASVLRRVGELSPHARERLLDDVEGEMHELSHLVDELVELALSRNRDETPEPVELASVAHRAGRHLHRRTGRLVQIDADGSVVLGRGHGLERAIGNLLENAAKFDSDASEPVTVHIREGRITVSDRGPGIAAADAARVFDRFYRADTARGLPGSGLGLSIVRDVAENHGGTVFAWTRSGGGASVGFTVSSSLLLPDSAPDSAEPLHADRSGVPTAPGDFEAGQGQSPRTPRSSSPARPG
ncbi:sensor histidine kinase [Streptomyces sp. TRM68416]|uniref:sensor histidine kinase n=1 Tax=Streptomyces sp. TRM68416 TaxID=2758412 RepID=UPI001661F5B0|nr:HAMP domain-containing sensor histidine kinase [Streptomyces sp. TRM68416]MBD0844752.1 HAMP domain-containing histidine kinase [Streptomyces sp. TRM68416]